MREKITNSEEIVNTGIDAIASISGKPYVDEVAIVCPNCKSYYTHIVGVGTLVGHDEFEAVAAYPGTATIGRSHYRRSAVEIIMNCEECPQLFSLVIQQHKGSNFVQIRQNIHPNDTRVRALKYTHA